MLELLFSGTGRLVSAKIPSNSSRSARSSVALRRRTVESGFLAATRTECSHATNTHIQHGEFVAGRLFRCARSVRFRSVQQRRVAHLVRHYDGSHAKTGARLQLAVHRTTYHVWSVVRRIHFFGDCATNGRSRQLCTCTNSIQTRNKLTLSLFFLFCQGRPFGYPHDSKSSGTWHIVGFGRS